MPYILVCAMVLLAGCASQGERARSAPRGQLQLEVTPVDGAEVYIDGDYQGVLSRWEGQVLPVEAGRRRVEVRSPGYLSRRVEVTVEPGARVRVQLDLEPQWDDVPAPIKRIKRAPSSKRDAP